MMSPQRGLAYTLSSIGLDGLFLLTALWVAQRLRNSLDWGKSLGEEVVFPLPIVLAVVLIWLVIFFALAVYDPRYTHRILDEFQRLVLAGCVCFLILAGLLYFSYRDVSRLMVIYFCGIVLLELLGWRLLFRLVMYQWYGQIPSVPRRILVIGSKDLLQHVAEAVQEYRWMGLELVGFVNDEPYEVIAGKPVLGTLHQTKAIVKQYQIDEVIAALPGNQPHMLQRLMTDLRELPVQIHVVPDYFHLALYRATVGNLGGLPLLHLSEPALTAYQRLSKRLFDLSVATLLLIFVVPLMGVIAILIKLESRGPVIFKQVRVGENARLFTMYKFRSMYGEDENLIYDEQGRPVHKLPDDPRVTRLGYFLRRTSLDELPQLLNVLKGDMSLVGPRPEMPWFVGQYEPWQHKRFAVPQGMTGWWQVNGRSNRPMQQHTEDDLYYIQNYSILLDLQILWKTIGAVIRREGAF